MEAPTLERAGERAAATIPQAGPPAAGAESSCGVFDSFWLGGFECSSHISARGVRLDMTAAIQHDIQAEGDYRRLREVGIRTARDGLRWHLIERGGRYNFASWTPMLEAAEKTGVQIIWDLLHYGWPENLDVFSSSFVNRFARFCRAAARIFREHSSRIPFYTPVNEINFLTWAATRGLMHPYAYGRDAELKRQLIRAFVAGAEAVWSMDPRARIVSAEPIIHTVPPRGKPQYAEEAAVQRASQFEAWDMLCGRRDPELGGHLKYLDITGVNFYVANQWEHPGAVRLHWDNGPHDERWMPLHKLLAEVHAHYHRPVLIAETGHYGSGRADWLREIAREVYEARVEGTPVAGVCLYPILDRTDWNDARHWHNCGLWDLALDDGCYRRVLHREYASELRRAQGLLASIGCR
jgi:beta-glucosidase/6-phospho-beta-glucosidase/beta-galactosidase